MTKRIRAAVGALCIAIPVALLAASAPAAAKPKPVTGKLSKPGYTVIALAANGKAKAVRTKPRKFKLRPPAKRVTLHLRAKDGTYAGPIVVGLKKRGKRAILGVKAGAKLGTVKVKRRKGYAKVKSNLPEKFVDAKRKARAKKGVPTGADRFGRVRSKHTGGGAPGDSDLDGIPEPLDIDDDGDLILDSSDRSSAARAAQAATPPPSSFGVLSTLSLGLGQTTNANHPALATQIDTALKSFGGLIFGLAGGPGGGSSELDCGGANQNPPRPQGLRYCRAGGTGRAPVSGTPPSPGMPLSTAAFPGDPGGPFDADGDGFGTLASFMGGPQLLHGATSAEIKTGDVLIELKNDASAFPTTLQYVFATVPALVSYDDDGAGGTPPKTLSYPYPSDLGNALPVAARPGGDPFAGEVVVTLTFWRPQRMRIAGDPEPQPGESATWTDIGGGVGYGAGAGGQPCPQSAFSDPRSEPVPNLLTLPPASPPGVGAPVGGPIAGGGGFTDQAPDQPANTNNKLTYTLNLTQCLRSNGSESSFDQSGEVLLFSLLATGRGGRADQALSFMRQ